MKTILIRHGEFAPELVYINIDLDEPKLLAWLNENYGHSKDDRRDKMFDTKRKLIPRPEVESELNSILTAGVATRVFLYNNDVGARVWTCEDLKDLIFKFYGRVGHYGN
jgi:hypothetical protein